MRKKRRKNGPSGMSTEMMVDVLFILLIFFILISSIKKNRDNIKIKAAKINKEKNTAAPKKTKEHILTIDKKNNIFFENEKISFEQLLDLLKKAKKNTPVDYTPLITLRTDAGSSSGQLLKIFVYLNQAGLADNVQCEISTSP